MTVSLPVAPKMVALTTGPVVRPGGPTLAEIKARAKAIKKHRKQEGRCFFYGICASLHALGFSF